MKSATHVFYDTSEDTKLQELTRLREKAYNDMVNFFSLAKSEGTREGKNQCHDKESATHVFYDMSEDTRLQELTRLREKAYNDMVNLFSLAYKEFIRESREESISIGYAEGISIGEQRGRREIINKLLKHGMSQAEIDAVLKEQP